MASSARSAGRRSARVSGRWADNAAETRGQQHSTSVYTSFNQRHGASLAAKALQQPGVPLIFRT